MFISDLSFLQETTFYTLKIIPFSHMSKYRETMLYYGQNHIGHDVIIEDHNFISSHVVISGFVTVKKLFYYVNATSAWWRLHLKHSLLPELWSWKILLKKRVYLPVRSSMSDKKSDEIKISLMQNWKKLGLIYCPDGKIRMDENTCHDAVIDKRERWYGENILSSRDGSQGAYIEDWS